MIVRAEYGLHNANAYFLHGVKLVALETFNAGELEFDANLDTCCVGVVLEGVVVVFVKHEAGNLGFVTTGYHGKQQNSQDGKGKKAESLRHGKWVHR